MLVYPRETAFWRLVLPLARRDLAEARDFLLWEAARVPWYLEPGSSTATAASLPDVLALLLAEAPPTPWALLPALMHAYGTVRGQATPRLWVEKTPHNELYARQMAHGFPGARLLYVLRDPRATLASVRAWQQQRQQPPLPVERFCLEWAASVRSQQRAAAWLPVHTLRYEDLVHQPQPTLTRLCAFLDIEMQASLLHPTFGGAQFGGFSSYTAYDTHFAGIEPSSLERWRTTLPARDIARLETLLAHIMAAYDYVPLHQPGPGARRVSWALARLARPVVGAARRVARREPAVLAEYRQARAAQGSSANTHTRSR